MAKAFKLLDLALVLSFNYIQEGTSSRKVLSSHLPKLFISSVCQTT